MTKATLNVVSHAIIATEALVFAALPVLALLLAMAFVPAPERSDPTAEDAEKATTAAGGETREEGNEGTE